LLLSWQAVIGQALLLLHQHVVVPLLGGERWLQGLFASRGVGLLAGEAPRSGSRRLPLQLPLEVVQLLELLETPGPEIRV
jgi:hypothetical protein